MSRTFWRVSRRGDDLARRSFAEKIALVEAMRERLAPLKRAREAKRVARLRRDGAGSGPVKACCACHCKVFLMRKRTEPHYAMDR